MSLLRKEVDRASSTGKKSKKICPRLRDKHCGSQATSYHFFPAASKLDASESASEQEEDFELISDEELRSATNEEEDDLENERDKIK